MVLWSDEHTNYQVVFATDLPLVVETFVGAVYVVVVVEYLAIVAVDNGVAQIYHEGSVLHFLHTESALSLGLNTPGAARKKQVMTIMMVKL